MTRSISAHPRSLSRTPVLASLALCVGLALPMQPSAAAAGGADTVRAFYITLTDTMRNGAQLGVQGRYARLAPVITGKLRHPVHDPARGRPGME